MEGVPSNAIKMRDAVSVSGVVKSVRSRSRYPPIGECSWVEDDDGVWSIYISENVSVAYYPRLSEPRVELVVGDWCYGEVKGAAISKVDGVQSLILGMDDGTYVSCPIVADKDGSKGVSQ